MIARYTVMENLYYQNPTMTLRADYKAALLALCGKILQWFVAAFKVDIERFLAQSELTSIDNSTNAMWEEIKAMDQACQKFTVVVEATEDDSESEDDVAETPESDADIEDVSDESTDKNIGTLSRSRKRKGELN
jgi:hypothetical protein